MEDSVFIKGCFPSDKRVSKETFFQPNFCTIKNIGIQMKCKNDSHEQDELGLEFDKNNSRRFYKRVLKTVGIFKKLIDGRMFFSRYPH